MNIGDKVIVTWTKGSHVFDLEPLEVGDIGVVYYISPFTGVIMSQNIDTDIKHPTHQVFSANFNGRSQGFSIDNHHNGQVKYIKLNQLREHKLERILK